MFVSRPIASVSQSGISVHTRANSFHIMSLLQSASSKKQCAEKRKANPVYEKDKTSKKRQDSWKQAASDEQRLWLTNNEAKSGIGNHCTSSYITECTTFKLEGIRDHERSTLHEHCIKIAQARKGPSQTDGARLK